MKASGVLKTTPLVSVVMPSFNQAQFIEASIRSVLDQSHSRLELIVMDGGSKDGTLAILERLAKHDARLKWCSEPDEGPAHAINKAMRLARGSVVGWLNSDDLYALDAVQSALMLLDGETNPLMVYGHGSHIDELGRHVGDYPTLKPVVGWAKLAHGCYVCQPTVFIKKVAVSLLGPLDQSLKTAFDFDWWLRAFLWFEGRIEFVDRVQSFSRLHADCITRKQRALVAAEGMWLIRKHMQRLDTRWVVSYLNETLPEGRHLNTLEGWANLYPHLQGRFSSEDLGVLKRIFQGTRSNLNPA
jgi:glycosyltransferase involved in cell wall biosynthesis